MWQINRRSWAAGAQARTTPIDTMSNLQRSLPTLDNELAYLEEALKADTLNQTPLAHEVAARNAKASAVTPSPPIHSQ